MVNPPRIMILDKSNIGLDVSYAAIASLGTLVYRESTTNDEVADLLRSGNIDVAVSNRVLFSSTVLEASRNLKLICLTATGTNTVDLTVAKRMGIAVSNIVAYSTDSVAQHSFALVLELLNHVAAFDARSRGFFTASAQKGMIPWTDLSLPIHEISGKAWGIIGLGRIGRKVAAIAEAFGAKVRWASVSGTDRSEPWRRVPLEELLKSSDIVSIHSPIGDRSRNLIDASKIALMKNTAILVNVGRGGIVNEVDLADALVKGRIAGAGLDVLWPEPPERTNALFRVASASGLQPGRLILTPHIAWAAVEARERAVAETALNIEAFLKGQRRNRVD